GRTRDRRWVISLPASLKVHALGQLSFPAARRNRTTVNLFAGLEASVDSVASSKPFRSRGRVSHGVRERGPREERPGENEDGAHGLLALDLKAFVSDQQAPRGAEAAAPIRTGSGPVSSFIAPPPSVLRYAHGADDGT